MKTSTARTSRLWAAAFALTVLGLASIAVGPASAATPLDVALAEPPDVIWLPYCRGLGPGFDPQGKVVALCLGLGQNCGNDNFLCPSTVITVGVWVLGREVARSQVGPI